MLCCYCVPNYHRIECCCATRQRKTILFHLSFSLEFEPLECELRLDDAGGLDPGPEHVLLRGHVVRAADAVEGVEIVGGAVVELQGHSSVESWLTF